MSDPTPPLLGHVEVPSSHEVTRHNGSVCRFRGWVASTRDRPTTVRVHQAGRPTREVAVRHERPDVLDALRGRWPVSTAQLGFEFYVDLPRPPWPSAPEVILELTDGQSSIPEMSYRMSAERETRYVPLVDGFNQVERVLETYDNDTPAKRGLAARWLHGRGIEFGALQQPLQIENDDSHVVYADRLTKAAALETYPELAEHYGNRMVEPQIILDLNVDDLSSLRAENFDFFILSDVIEHLANPLLFLKRVHDVMKPGARLLLSVPDRRYTDDVERPLTSIQHLEREYRRRVTRVSNGHVRRFLRDTQGARLRPPVSRRVYDINRERTFHVHVWENDSFDELLHHAIRQIPLSLEIVDSLRAEEHGGAMVYVLERGQAPA